MESSQEQVYQKNLEKERETLKTMPVYLKDDLTSHFLKKYRESSQSKVTSLRPMGVFKVDPAEEEQERIVLASYPRCGNTLLRSYLEQQAETFTFSRIMGLVTGSDCDIDRPLNLALYEKGFVGEGLIDSRFWIIKSHYPDRFSQTFYFADKCILCIRNPLDCMVSLFNMVATDTHDCSISLEDYKKFASLWDGFVKQEGSVWYDFYRFWMSSNLPVHLVRYEDVVEHPKEVFTELFKFILETDSIANTNIAKYIEMKVAEGIQQIYKPRIKLTEKVTDLFSQEQLSFLMDNFGDLLVQVGYDEQIAGVQNLTYKKFIHEFNQASLKKVIESEELVSIKINEGSQLLRAPKNVKPFRSLEMFAKAIVGYTKVIDSDGKEREGQAVQYLNKLGEWITQDQSTSSS